MGTSPNAFPGSSADAKHNRGFRFAPILNRFGA